MSLLLLLAANAASADILVTASLTPVDEANSPASATVIDARRIDALGEAQAVDLLRLVPGVSVAQTGARGSQAQVRIRGGEANHSLLFIDGIRFTDPAAGNEARFETLTADGIGRIEVVRGPQSALWGSEAIGGVIALETPDAAPGLRISGLGEYGSRDSLRLAGTIAAGGERGGATLTVSRQESDGIDILGGGTGDRDGYDNTTIGLKGVARPAENAEFGVAARYVDAHAEFDGTDPLTFLRADTEDNSTTRTGAVRVWATLGTDPGTPWRFTVDGQYLGSANRNFDGDVALNRSFGDRFAVSGKLERRLDFGGTRHSLIALVEREDESFKARDQEFGGSTDQDRTRGRTAFVGEWRADWGDVLTTDLAVRHDDFSRFADETTFRAGALARLGGGFAVAGSYGEGIAQPTFFDLYGFFPGSFVGNPDLIPERSREFELGLRWQSERAALSVTAFDARLRDEIVGTFDSTTFLSSAANATGISKRRGVELAGALTPTEGLRLNANYTWLDAKDQQVAGTPRLREVRRPRHSASAAFDYETGALTLGGSIAYVGKRRDTDFDLFPAATVTLDDYALVGFRAAYRITPAIEAFGRLENAFDADYQDVVGYATPGRAVHAGLRLRFGA